jgi:predicted TPR repeat methyltransferase
LKTTCKNSGYTTIALEDATPLMEAGKPVEGLIVIAKKV